MFQSRFGLRTSIAAVMASIVGGLGLAGAASQAMNAFTYRAPRFGQGRRGLYTWHKSFSRRYPPNGLQECATRRRQIADGQLREQNGLCLEAAA